MRRFRVIYLLSSIVAMVVIFLIIDISKITERIATIASICSFFAFAYLIVEVLSSNSETKKISEAVTLIRNQYIGKDAEKALNNLRSMNREILRLIGSKSFASLESKFEEWKTFHSEIVENPVLKEFSLLQKIDSKGSKINGWLGNLKGFENEEDLQKINGLIFWFNSYDDDILSLKSKLHINR